MHTNKSGERFVVCVKQVPDTTEIKIDPKTNTLIREGVPSILNPFDQFALEECVRVRDKFCPDAEIIAVSMGPPQARTALLKCLAIGADKAILVTDRAFAGADTYATSYTLFCALKKIGSVDIVFCGQQAIDGDTAQVGPELAQHLGIPQHTYVESVEKIEGRKITVKAQCDEGYKIAELKMPALLTCTPHTSFVPTSPPMSMILKAKKKLLLTWALKDFEELGVDKSKFGLSGSPTQVIKVYSPPARGKGLILEGEPAEVTKELTKKLFESGAIK